MANLSDTVVITETTDGNYIPEIIYNVSNFGSQILYNRREIVMISSQDRILKIKLPKSLQFTLYRIVCVNNDSFWPGQVLMASREIEVYLCDEHYFTGTYHIMFNNGKSVIYTLHLSICIYIIN